MIFQLFYLSRSAVPITDGLILATLETSRRNNARLDLTGRDFCFAGTGIFFTCWRERKQKSALFFAS